MLTIRYRYFSSLQHSRYPNLRIRHGPYFYRPVFEISCIQPDPVLHHIRQRVQGHFADGLPGTTFYGERYPVDVVDVEGDDADVKVAVEGLVGDDVPAGDGFGVDAGGSGVADGVGLGCGGGEAAAGLEEGVDAEGSAGSGGGRLFGGVVLSGAGGDGDGDFAEAAEGAEGDGAFGGAAAGDGDGGGDAVGAVEGDVGRGEGDSGGVGVGDGVADGFFEGVGGGGWPDEEAGAVVLDLEGGAGSGGGGDVSGGVGGGGGGEGDAQGAVANDAAEGDVVGAALRTGNAGHHGVGGARAVEGHVGGREGHVLRPFIGHGVDDGADVGGVGGGGADGDGRGGIVHNRGGAGAGGRGLVASDVGGGACGQGDPQGAVARDGGEADRALVVAGRFDFIENGHDAGGSVDLHVGLGQGDRAGAVVGHAEGEGAVLGGRGAGRADGRGGGRVVHHHVAAGPDGGGGVARLVRCGGRSDGDPEGPVAVDARKADCALCFAGRGHIREGRGHGPGAVHEDIGRGEGNLVGPGVVDQIVHRPGAGGVGGGRADFQGGHGIVYGHRRTWTGGGGCVALGVRGGPGGNRDAQGAIARDVVNGDAANEIACRDGFTQHARRGPGGIQGDIGGGQGNFGSTAISHCKGDRLLTRDGSGRLTDGDGGRQILGYGDGCGVRPRGPAAGDGDLGRTHGHGANAPLGGHRGDTGPVRGPCEGIQGGARCCSQRGALPHLQVQRTWAEREGSGSSARGTAVQ